MTVLLLLISPLMWLAAVLALALTDVAHALMRALSRLVSTPGVGMSADAARRSACATVVIPNWNGRDLLERYLPSVIQALAGHPENEIIVVDNGSTDGSAEFVRRAFPDVKLLALDRNLGFGGGSNAGFHAAKNDIVVLLNSDMRVSPDFLPPLLEGFRDQRVFAVSCQIFFRDPAKLREETGLTQGWWQDGGLKVRHRADPAIHDLFPCFYGGGGSCAFDRGKFLELGGFDDLLAPFYLEDTDLSYMAWKRGWKVLYQPRSIVYHEHRGTIGKRFSEAQIQAVLKKNYLLFCWKNIHDWRRLAAHFIFSYGGALLSMVSGDAPGRANPDGWWRAFRQLPGAVRSRWRARELAVVDDTEAFRRPLGGYFRDRFGEDRSLTVRAQNRLRVLFVSPYPICPPIHGGGVFMYQTLRELVKLATVHVVTMLDDPSQAAAQEELRSFCASAEFVVRPPTPASLGSMRPHAVSEFANEDLDWLIHRQIYLHRIDVVQLEYTPLGQYARAYCHIPTILFEHDIYFQSIARALAHMPGALARIKARYEYLRALRNELGMLPRCDRVQVCTRENGEYLASFLPRMRGRLQAGLRAGIDTSRYEFAPEGREPFTMLFLGSFRHEPNVVALDWFVNEVLPRIAARQRQARRPEARLVVVGSDAPQRHPYADRAPAVEIRGFVDDVREPLSRYAVFVCPVRSGSGVRVKLLEAFASGIPVVSTRIGAEGLAREPGEFCSLADQPEQFAEEVLRVFDDPTQAAEMAARARSEVVANWDMAAITARLVESYGDAVREKNPTLPSARGPL
jgi:GT2 family glycosyltransferase/glycosyltransferase involved in cell wall biosynthesis